MNKFARIMKLSILIFIMSLGHLFASKTYSQQTPITIHLNNVSIKNILSNIEKDSDYRFVYSNELIDVNRKMDLNVKNLEISNILDKLFAGYNVNHKVHDKQIILSPTKLTKKISISQQAETITGTVKDASGSILGVSIIIKGTTTGIVSDFDGMYSIKASKGDVLIYSHIGYTSQEVTVDSSNVIEIIMEADLLRLDEIIVVGYGNLKKSDLTAAISSVKAEDLIKSPVSNPALALQARVSGVSVTQTSGAPGAEIDIKVRGLGTVGNNTPLYIIDGIPGSMYYLSTEDIASIEILKDAAAAAIYGSRAANGVIIVTTKKGKIGKIKVQFSSYLAIVQTSKKLNLLNGEEYIQYHKTLYANSTEKPAFLNSPAKNNTNWQDEVFRSGLKQNYRINISGANQTANYSLSAYNLDEKGTLIGTQFKKRTLRTRLGMTKGRFELNSIISYVEIQNNPLVFSFREVYQISPLIKAIDPDAESGYGLSYDGITHNRNPLGDNKFKNRKRTTERLTTNLDITLNITDCINIKSRFGYINNNYSSKLHTVPNRINSKEPTEYATNRFHNSNSKFKTMEHLLNFNKKFNKHSFIGLLGYTASSSTEEWINTEVEGRTTIRIVFDGKIKETKKRVDFADLDFRTLDGGIGGTYTANGSENTYNRTSFLGRLNYNYNNKYLLQTTVRRDGSSKFGENSRYGTFPSIALGWRISQESFINNIEAINNIKLRVSWGKLGNESTLGYYDNQALISKSNDFSLAYVKGSGLNPWTGSIAKSLEDKNMKWEVTRSVNLGLDYTIFNNISGSVNYYNNLTSDMLITQLVPLSAGINNPILNVGEIKNQGLEFELSYNASKGDFEYAINTSISFNKNKVTKLSTEDQIIYGQGLQYGDSHFVTQTKVGNEIGAFYLYETDGLFQNQAEVDAHNAKGIKNTRKSSKPLQVNAKAGDVRFKDINGDGQITEADKTYQGSGIAKYEYNLNINCSYKDFDLSMLFMGVGGNKIYNGNKYKLEGMRSDGNALHSVLNAWTPTNKNTSIPRTVLTDPNRNTRESTRYLEDGDYFRLKNIQLAYTLPKNIINYFGIDMCRFYVSADNVFVITGYSGLDPEVSSMGNLFSESTRTLNLGIDMQNYHINKTFTFGVQLNF